MSKKYCFSFEGSETYSFLWKRKVSEIAYFSMHPLRSLLRCLLTIVAVVCVSCQKAPTVRRGEFAVPRDGDVSHCKPGIYGGIMVLTSPAEPKGFNFLTAVDLPTMQALNMLMNALVRQDPFTQEFLPALAKSWDIKPDRKTYVFHLREGIRWSDGEPFTADDVVFTFDCIFAKEVDQSGVARYKFPNRHSEQLTIDGKTITWTKTDAHTVTITTPVPYVPFLSDLAGILILPKHKLKTAFKNGQLLQQWTLQTAIESPQEIVGTGPFTIHSYKPGESLILEPNPHYWRVDQRGQRLPYIDFLITQFIHNPNTQTILFSTGQTDASPLSPTDFTWVSKLQSTYHFTLYDRGPAALISFLWFNLNPNSKDRVQSYKLKWFAQKEFRQAIAYSMNREGMIQTLYFGHGRCIHSIISETNRKWFNPNVKKYPYQPQKAKQLLKAIGFSTNKDGLLIDPEGHTVEFELLDANPGDDSYLTILQQNLKDIGIQMRLAYVDFGTMLDRLQQNHYEAACMALSSTSTDPSEVKSLLLSSGDMHLWNPKQLSPATSWEREIDQLVHLQEQTFDEQQRLTHVRRIQTIFSEQIPLIFLISPNHFTGIKDKWQNIRIPPSYIPVSWNIEEIWEGRRRF